jgi:hypothetical protein
MNTADDLIRRAQQVRIEMLPSAGAAGLLDHVCFMLALSPDDANELEDFINQELARVKPGPSRIAATLVLGIELGIAADRIVRETIG